MRLLTLLLFIALLYSCAGNDEEQGVITQVETGTPNTDKATKTNTVKTYKASEVLPRGTWINHVYLKALTESRSPHKSQNVFWDGTAGNTGYVTFNGDTFSSWHHVHRGAYRLLAEMIDPYTFEVRNNKTNAVIYKGKFTPDYKELTLQPITVPGKTTTLIYYPEATFNESFNAMMIAGMYTRYDASGKETGEITFEKDGALKGVAGHKEYIMFYDFNGRGMNIDQIAFGTDRRTAQLYSWQQKGDTINLYTMKCTQKVDNDLPDGPFNCVFYDHGKLHSRLVRKR